MCYQVFTGLQAIQIAASCLKTALRPSIFVVSNFLVDIFVLGKIFRFRLCESDFRQHPSVKRSVRMRKNSTNSLLWTGPNFMHALVFLVEQFLQQIVSLAIVVWISAVLWRSSTFWSKPIGYQPSGYCFLSLVQCYLRKTRLSQNGGSTWALKTSPIGMWWACHCRLLLVGWTSSRKPIGKRPRIKRCATLTLKNPEEDPTAQSIHKASKEEGKGNSGELLIDIYAFECESIDFQGNNLQKVILVCLEIATRKEDNRSKI